MAWEYHVDRIKKSFQAANAVLDLSYVTVEEIVDEAWDGGCLPLEKETIQKLFQERYGFNVGWPEVKERGLESFAKREQKTKLALLLGKKGWVLKTLTHLKGSGRLDDLSPEGAAIIGDATPPRYPRAWRLASSVMTRL